MRTSFNAFRGAYNPQLNRSARQRGFTLVELMVVVIIIAISAAMVIPMATRQMRDFRVQRHAREVASTYRNARMLAMARGGAVLVRFQANAIEVREGIVGSGTTACRALPDPSCNRSSPTAWDTAANYHLTRRVVSLSGDPGITIQLEGTNTKHDVCYTPMGRTMHRSDLAARFDPMTAAMMIEVFRGTTTAQMGLVRNVAVLPSGTARLTIAELK